MSPEERARRIKYNIPDDPAKRALTPEQKAAIARLTGNVPGRTPRSPHRSREAPPSDRAHPQSAPDVGAGQQRTEISGLRARHASDLSEATGRERPRDDFRRPDGPRSGGPDRDRAEPPSSGSERPGNDQRGEFPYSDQPGTEQPVDDHQDSADTGPGDDPGHDGPHHAADLDRANAQIADLKRQLAERDAKLDAANARIDEQATEIAQQKERIGEQSRGLEEASSKIGALENRVADQDSILGDVLERMQRLENGGTDGTARGVDRHETPQRDTGARLDHPEQATEGLPDQGRADEPAVDEHGWAERADGPKARRAGPTNEALGFMLSGATTAFTGVSDILPPAEAGLGLAGGLLGMGVAGIAWLRQRRKAKNADRPEG